MKGIEEKQYKYGADLLEKLISELEKREFSNQQEFDSWHKKSCLYLREKMKQQNVEDFTIGHAQKWLNMTLKYLVALKSKKYDYLNKIYQFFHIPVDRIIIQELTKKDNRFLKHFNLAWSKTDDYNTYLQFQKKVREVAGTTSVLTYEFELYNNA